jgi:hypothetical protein
MEGDVFWHWGLDRHLQGDLRERHLEVDFLLDQVVLRLFCLEVQDDVGEGLQMVECVVDWIEVEELDGMLVVNGRIVVVVVGVGTSSKGGRLKCLDDD